MSGICEHFPKDSVRDDDLLRWMQGPVSLLRLAREDMKRISSQRSHGTMMSNLLYIGCTSSIKQVMALVHIPVKVEI